MEYVKSRGKRGLALFLALVLCVSMLGTTAFATEGEGMETLGACTDENCSHVAAIGEQHYDTLQEAVNVGGEVTLLKDIPTSKRVTIKESVTIDLNGKSIGGGDKFATIMVNSEDAKVEIKNGSLSDASAARGTVYVQLGEVALTDVTIDASARGVGIGPGVAGYYGKATLNHGTTINAKESGVGIFGPGDGTSPKSELIVNEGVSITSELYGIAGNGSNDDTTITINGGNVTANGGYSASPEYSAGIYHPQQGTLNIHDGTISGKVGVQMAAGTAVIDGGTLISTDTDAVASPYKAAQQGDGMVLDGAALSLVSRKAYGDIDVTVTGGEFKVGTAENKAIQKYGMQKASSAWEVIDEPTTSKLAVSGGIFDSDVSEYCVAGTKWDESTKGLVADTNEETVATVGNRAFVTLQDAIDAAEVGETVILLKDISLSKAVTIPKSLILDLGGKTVSADKTTAFEVQGATVSVKNGNIKVNAARPSENSYAILAKDGAKVTLEKDLIAESTGNAVAFPVQTQSDSAVKTELTVYGTLKGTGFGSMGIGGNNTLNKGIVEVNVYSGAVVTSNGGMAIFNPMADSTINVYGGTITGGTGILMRAGTLNIPANSDAVISADMSPFKDFQFSYGNISGGNITGAGVAIDPYSETVINIDNGTISGTYGLFEYYTKGETSGNVTLNVTGGTIITNNENYTLDTRDYNFIIKTKPTENGQAVYSRECAKFITGGTFSNDVNNSETAMYVADSYIAHPVSNQEGYFNVHQSGEVWRSDAANHWKNCQFEGCSVIISESEPHTFGDWVTDTAAQVGVAGTRHRDCSVCAYRETGSIAALPGGGGSGGGGGGTVTPPTPPTPPEIDIDDPDVPLAQFPLPFVDVSSQDWFREAVAYTYKNSLMNGVESTIFAPDTDTSRGMVVTMLHRQEKEPSAPTSNFSDVLAGTWYKEAVDWAAEVGVVNGISTDKYAPENDVTREQLVTILYRYAQMKGCDVSARADLSKFTDADQVSGYATEAMSWAVAAGLIEGTSATTLNPTGNATRAQVAAIMMRLCENVLPKENIA